MADKKKEKKPMKQFLDERKEDAKKGDYATASVGCGTGLSGMICRHNRKKLNHGPIFKSKEEFVKKFKKAYSLDNEVPYSVQAAPIPPAPIDPAAMPKAEEKMESHPDVVQDVRLIDDMVHSALDTHNALYHQGQMPGEPIKPEKGSIRLKYGNIELEIKKSVQDFAKSFKGQKTAQKEEIRKTVAAWRRNVFKSAKNDSEAAKELLKNWDVHKESFNQILFAVEQLEKSKNGKKLS